MEELVVLNTGKAKGQSFAYLLSNPSPALSLICNTGRSWNHRGVPEPEGIPGDWLKRRWRGGPRYFSPSLFAWAVCGAKSAFPLWLQHHPSHLPVPPAWDSVHVSQKPWGSSFQDGSGSCSGHPFPCHFSSSPLGVPNFIFHLSLCSHISSRIFVTNSLY